MMQLETILTIVKVFSILILIVRIPFMIHDHFVSRISPEQAKENWEKRDTGVSYKTMHIIDFILFLVAMISHLALYIIRR